VHLNTLLVHFSGSLWHSERAIRLKEHSWTSVGHFAHHVKSFLETDYARFQVQIRSLVQFLERDVGDQTHKLKV
jgi:hypothetical protein